MYRYNQVRGNMSFKSGVVYQITCGKTRRELEGVRPVDVWLYFLMESFWEEFAYGEGSLHASSFNQIM